MATEKAIVNVSQAIVSLAQGRLMPGGIFRVADYFRRDEDVRSDVTLQKFLRAGYVSIQDIDFQALAQAREAVHQADLDRAAELAGQADAERARRAAQEAAQQHASLVAEGKALAAREAQVAAQAVQEAAPSAPPPDNLDVLFETSRKQRIALKQAERERAVEAPTAGPRETSEDRMVSPEDLLDMHKEAQAAPPVEPLTERGLVGFQGGFQEEDLTPVEVPVPHPTPLPAVPEALRDTPVAPEVFTLDDLTDDQLRRVAVVFEVKGAKKAKRAVLLKAIEALGLNESQLREILAEE